MASAVTIEEIPDKPIAAKNEEKKPSPPVECNIGLVCDAFEALSTLANDKLDTAATAKIVKLAKWCEPIYEDYTDLRKTTASRLGTPVAGEEGKISIPRENVAEFVDTINKMAKEVVKVPKRLKLSLEDLEGAKVSPAVLIRMRFFVSDMDE